MTTRHEMFENMLNLERAISKVSKQFRENYSPNINKMGEKKFSAYYTASHLIEMLTHTKCALSECLEMFDNITWEE